MCDQPPARTIQLPAELWIAVFEQLSDPAHTVHIFNQSVQGRLENTRQLQKLQHVCRAWRDMIRPLTYRHVALTGLEVLRGRGDYNLWSFMYFIESWDLNKNLRGRNSCWIETLILRHDRNFLTKDDERFIVLFRDFLSQLTHLTEITCCTLLYAKDFEPLVAASHGTLRKLLVNLGGDDLPGIFLALPRFRAIEDLSISCDLQYYYNVTFPKNLDEVLDLPHLRHLELCSTNLGLEFFLSWFLRLLPTKLKVLNVRTIAFHGITREVLLPFLTKHGATLETLNMGGAGFGLDAADLLVQTPNLKHLGLFAMYESIAMFLDKLPAQVEKVILSRHIGRLYTPWTLMADLLKWLEQLPRPNALRVVHIAGGSGLWSNDNTSWRLMLENVNATEEQLRKVVELMEHFRALGIRMLDGEGMALEDYILQQLETPHPAVRTIF